MEEAEEEENDPSQAWMRLASKLRKRVFLKRVWAHLGMHLQKEREERQLD